MNLKIRKDKHGFSLVELIIVIAIMAILVGILTPQFIKYVEKAKVAKCATIRDNLLSELNVAYASNQEDALVTPGVHTLSSAQAERYKCSDGGTITYEVNTDSNFIAVECSKHGDSEEKSFGDAETMAKFLEILQSVSGGSNVDSTATEGNNAKQQAALEQLKEAGLGYLLNGVSDWRYNGNNFYFTYQPIPQDKPTTMLMIQYRPDSKHFTVWKTTTKINGSYYVLGNAIGSCLNPDATNDQTFENAYKVYHEELQKLNSVGK